MRISTNRGTDPTRIPTTNRTLLRARPELPHRLPRQVPPPLV